MLASRRQVERFRKLDAVVDLKRRELKELEDQLSEVGVCRIDCRVCSHEAFLRREPDRIRYEGTYFSQEELPDGWVEQHCCNGCSRCQQFYCPDHSASATPDSRPSCKND